MARTFDLREQTDEALLSAFVDSGDTDALETLLGRHENRVFSLSYRLLGVRADALDATQEVFLLVFRRAETFKGRSSFTSWLYRLTVNTCYDLGREKNRTPVPTEAVDSPTRDLAEAAGAGIDVHRALGTLPPEQRAAVVMRDMLGLPYEEIARIAGVAAGTVKSRIARGRLALSATLGGSRREPDGSARRLSSKEPE